MKYRKLTIAFIVLIVLLVAGYDITIAVLGGEQATISATLLAIARQWPIVPFMLGLLAGHLFFPNKGDILK